MRLELSPIRLPVRAFRIARQWKQKLGEGRSCIKNSSMSLEIIHVQIQMIFYLIYKNIQFLEILLVIQFLKLPSFTNQPWPQQRVKSIVRYLIGLYRNEIDGKQAWIINAQHFRKRSKKCPWEIPANPNLITLHKLF